MARRWKGGHSATDQYRDLVASRIEDGMTVLHAGCGWDRSGITGPHADRCRVVGIDLDPRVASLFHSEFILGSAESLPFPGGTFDLITCEYVLEHVEDPPRVFAEIARVLKPGGTFLGLTPNVASYKSLGAAITPQPVHHMMGRLRYGPGQEEDMYRTHYRANSHRRIGRLAERAGLELVRFGYVNNGPTWFVSLPLVFEAFDVFHRAIDAGPGALLRCAIVFEARKPA